MHQSIGLRGLTLDAGESATQVCPATEHSAHLRMASRFQNLEIFLLHSPRRLQCGKAARFLLNARSAHCFPESATETPSHCTNNISSTATDSTVVLPDARARGGGKFCASSRGDEARLRHAHTPRQGPLSRGGLHHSKGQCTVGA